VKIAIDWDGTIVKMDRPYNDLETPPQFMDGAERALRSLKAAGHILLLWSARSSRALLFDPLLDPLIRSGAVPLDMDRWRSSQALNVARHRQMLDFVAERLPNVFDAIDDGAGGKPSVDTFIDDRALRLGDGMGGVGWHSIAEMYGDITKVSG
jgi:hypothetical protein